MASQLSHDHHTVPEFFLRRFLESGQQKLREYNKPLGKWRYTAPSVATVDRDANVYGFEGGLTDVVEQEFSRIETNVSRVLPSIGQQSRPTDYEREGLGAFVALQLLRGRMLRSFWERAKREFERLETALAFVKEKRADVAQKFAEDELDRYEKELIDEQRGLRLPKGFGLDRIGPMQHKLGAIILRMKWRLEIARSDEFFVVSDTPFVLTTNQTSKCDGIVGLCRDDLGVELSCPLDPKKCLVIGWAGAEKWAISVPKTRVQEVNRRTAAAAQISVYAGPITPRTQVIVESQRRRAAKLLT